MGTDQLKKVQGTGPIGDTPWVVDVTLVSRRIRDVDTYSSQYADEVSGTMKTDDLRLTIAEKSEKRRASI